VVIASGAVALERLLHEAQRRVLVARLRDVALEYLTFLVDRSPEVNHLAVELHVHLIEVPSPVAKPAHATDPLATNITREYRAEPVPPMAHCLVADVDAALEQQVLHIPQ
jgi:hypothetical protein